MLAVSISFYRIGYIINQREDACSNITFYFGVVDILALDKGIQNMGDNGLGFKDEALPFLRIAQDNLIRVHLLWQRANAQVRLQTGFVAQ